MPPLCYFVRHGQTGWNAELRLQGQADTDITDVGRAQAVRNGRRLAGLVDDPDQFDFVASPLGRSELVRLELLVVVPLAYALVRHGASPFALVRGSGSHPPDARAG